MIDGHRETWPLRSKRFRAWLRQQYYERTWDAPTPSAMSAALNVLEAQAQFDGPERKVSVRVAEHDGLIYLDLADEFWRCVEIGPRGWRIADDVPVRFRRPAGMLPLPLPARGGSIEALAPFLNLPEPRRLRARRRLAAGSAARQTVPIRCWPYRANRARRRPCSRKCCGRWSIPASPRCGPCRARTANCSSRPTTATSWPSTISPACHPGCRTPSAGSRAAAPSRSVNSTPTRMRCCLPPPGRSFSTASRT